MNRLLLIQPLHLLLVAAVIAALYGASLKNGFVWDDHQIIVNNPLLADIRALPRLLLAEDTFPGLTTGYYRPLTYLSFLLDRTVWGDRALGFTLTNILLHLLTSISLYRLVRLLCSDHQPALYAAIIFAAHPVASEAVNFHAGGRNTLLCTLFMVLTFISHLQERRVRGALCFSLALLSKEFALVLPIVLLLHDRLVAGKRPSPRVYLPYGLLAAAYLLLRFLVVSGSLLSELQVAKALTVMPELLATYLFNFIAPINLKTIYTLSGSPLGFSLALLLLVAGGVFLLRRDPLIPFAAAMGLLLLLPVLNFVPIGATSMADRHAYPALAAFSLALARILHRCGKRFSIGLTAAIILCYGVIGIQRSGIWRNDFTLYSRMIADAPANGIGYQNLGMYYYNSGDSEQALKYLSECYRLGEYNPEALFALAAISFEAGDHLKAATVLKRLDSLFPGNPQTHVILGRIHEAAGDARAAGAQFARAREIFPDIDRLLEERAGQLCREGEQLLASGNHRGAEQKFRSALLLKPDFVPAMLDKGILLAERGEGGKALELFLRAMQLAPDNPAAHYNASLIYRDRGELAAADRELAISRRLSGK